MLGMVTLMDVPHELFSNSSDVTLYALCHLQANPSRLLDQGVSPAVVVLMKFFIE